MDDYKLREWLTPAHDANTLYQIIDIHKINRKTALTLASINKACFVTQYLDNYTKLSPLLSEILNLWQKSISEKKIT